MTSASNVAVEQTHFFEQWWGMTVSHQSGNTSHTGVGKWAFRFVMIFTSRCEDDASLHLMGFSIRLKNMLLMWVLAPGMDIGRKIKVWISFWWRLSGSIQFFQKIVHRYVPSHFHTTIAPKRFVFSAGRLIMNGGAKFGHLLAAFLFGSFFAGFSKSDCEALYQGRYSPNLLASTLAVVAGCLVHYCKD